ncbi:hypothetical protein DUI87_00144 [Hirundo rustica rustica]|uniref:Uncharacterized protein n=1 Tax=Hirundo rustica rustica TaxID=333673 RepID=A0A3M0LC45_HIRRU|nr:hypothetical protein DUI87_00144 [Hirundo rustica rustica]
MAQALSAEEFQRMQSCRGLRQRVQTLDRDLAKANKALSKSKKAQEVEALLGETRMLQGKLQSQEDDFRLQNSTLLRELAKAEVAQLQEEVAKPVSGTSRRAEAEALRARCDSLAQELQQLQARGRRLQHELEAAPTQEELGQLRAALGEEQRLRGAARGRGTRPETGFVTPKNPQNPPKLLRNPPKLPPKSPKMSPQIPKTDPKSPKTDPKSS